MIITVSDYLLQRTAGKWFLWSHVSRLHSGKKNLTLLAGIFHLAMRSAMRYLGPNFSNSAMTQSVMMGVTLAYRQFICESQRNGATTVAGGNTIVVSISSLC